MKLYRPSEIPLSYFYFGYKKAKHYVTREASFCDFYELELFESQLEKEIYNLKSEFENYKNIKEYVEVKSKQCERYQLKEAVIYWFPKSWDEDQKPRMRPKGIFSFKDQVAWATVILALSEWFDTSIKTREMISLERGQQREALEWMVPWSFNNRIKRIHSYNEITNEYERGLVHYNGSSIYESYQWGLRQKNSQIKEAAKKLLEKHDEIYMGETDIQEFYPSLRLSHIQQTLFNRLDTLYSCGVLSASESMEWKELLRDLLAFKLIFPDLEQLDQKMLEDFKQKILPINCKDETIDLKELLQQTLPLDIIASGFLSNCALTEILDIELTEFIAKSSDSTARQTYLFRYTDDITILSPNQSFITIVMKEVKRLLGKFNLRLSESKTIPLDIETHVNEKLEEVKNTMNTKEKKISPEQEQAIKEAIKKLDQKLFEPIKITQRDNLPGSTAMIEKMSHIGDMQLLTMDNRGLETYILEMINLLDMKFDSSEIKDETKVTFASWRIRSGVYELLQRATDAKPFEGNFPLQRAIEKFPYKISLYEIYILILLDYIVNQDSEDAFKLLNEFLQKFALKSSLNKVGSAWEEEYFPFIRTKILFVISHEWFRVPKSWRGRFRHLLDQIIQIWYAAADKIRWHEKYAIYYSFSILKIKTDPKFTPYHQNKSVLHSLNRLRIVYALSNDFYYQNDEKAKEKVESSAISTENILAGELLFFCSIFKKGLHYSRFENYKWSSFEEALYPSIFELLNLEKLSLSNEERELIWINIAQIDVTKIPISGWGFLDKVIVDDKKSKENTLSILSILQKAINAFFAHPKKMHAFAKWIKTNSNSYMKKYATERFEAYSIIQQYFLVDEKGGYSFPVKIPGSLVLEKNNIRQELHGRVLSLADWLFYIETNPSKTITALQPLNEHEKVFIFSKLMGIIQGEKEYAKNQNGHDFLYQKGISIKNWIDFRDKQKVELVIEDCNHEFKLFFRYPGVDVILKSFKNDHTRLTHSSIYLKSITLLSLLIGNTFEYKIIKPFYIFSWKDLQSIFHQAHFPSAQLSILMVNTLNSHRRFYEESYQYFDYSTLPYRKLGEKTVDSDYSYNRVIRDYLKNTSKNLLRSQSMGIIEMIEIDLDLMKRSDLK